MERISSDSWQEWRRHVLTELERLHANNGQIDASIDKLREDIHEDLAKMNIEIATLKIKSGIWGMFAGLIPVAIAVLMKLIK